MWPRDLAGGHGMEDDNFGLRWQVERDTALKIVAVDLMHYTIKSAVAARLCRRSLKS
jgi:hypothetical protein